jgi:hypothetical protein
MKNQVHAPVGQRHYSVGRSANTNCHALECPVGTLEAHPVCSIPELRPANLALRSTKLIARFLRVFYTLARFLRVFYTLDCPANQYPFSSGRQGVEGGNN